MTLDVPLLPPEPSSPSTSADTSPSRSATPSAEPQIVTLHLPLVERSEFESLQHLPTYSTVFNILIDGAGFLPPRFDPNAIAPATPQVGAVGTSGSGTANSSIFNSPALQRALLSPLLSPQRRAASQGSDISVPPLSLGMARGRAPSVSGPSSTETGPQHVNSSGRRASASNGRSASSSRPPRGLALLNPALSPSLSATIDTSSSAVAHRPSLDSVLATSVSSRAKQTAEDILSLRRTHDAFVKRTKAELEVLQTRISNAGQLGGSSAGGSSGLVVKGFGTSGRSSAETSKSPSARREPSTGRGSRDREGSRDRVPSEERGRSARAGPRSSDLDEERSRQIREDDERQEEERGRSLSRTRRDDSAGSAGGKSKHVGGGGSSSSRSRIKSVVQTQREKEAAGQGDKAIKTPLPASVGAGQSISASLDDTEIENSPALEAPRMAKGSVESTASPMFVPSSHALVAIPESDELSLPPSQARTPEIAPSPKAFHDSDSDSEEGTSFGPGNDTAKLTLFTRAEHDTPFEMDEDIDVDNLHLEDGESKSVLLEPEFEEATVPHQPTGSPVSTRTGAVPVSGSSYRRSSNLSASYATLLSTSASRNSTSSMMPAPSSGSYRPPSMASFKAPPPLFADRLQRTNSHGSSVPLSRDSLATSPNDSPHPTSTSVRQDTQIRLNYVPSPDPKAARMGEDKIRQVLAMDAPSHRDVLPSRTRRRTSDRRDQQDSPLDEEDDVEARGGREAPPPRFAVGSLPISIGMARPPTSQFRPAPERELERKTSVPSREGMFVPPLLRAGSGSKKTVRVVEPVEQRGSSEARANVAAGGAIEIGEKRDTSRTLTAQGSATVGGSSSLAQSLRNPNGQRSFASQVVEEADESGAAGTGGSGQQDAEDEDEEFVPPHEFLRRRGRSDEELLSRSVGSDAT